jgi:glycosyltransferase involved in cell wall biosynthesis
MKVIYEASNLGIGHFDKSCRAGIFRYIEDLTDELLKIPDFEINFTSTNNLLETILLRQYFEEKKPDLTSLNVEIWHSHIISNHTYSHLFKNCQDKNSKKISDKLLRKTQASILKIANLFSFEKTQKNPKKFDVYHSFFSALPSHDKDFFKSREKIITIYDMIPFLYSNCFNKTLIQYFTSVIKSIDYHKDWVICISESTKNDFCHITKMSPERVFVTPLAASKCFYLQQDKTQIKAIRNKYNIPEGKYILALSTLEPRKNTAHLIKCFYEIIAQEKINDLCLVLVGSQGWLYDEIFQMADSKPHLKNKVIFTGYLPDEELSSIYSGASFFVYPSLYEGFGLPPLEAMQCGVPVITSNTSSLPEVVGDAGILINPKDKDELCQAMLKLLREESLCQQLSLNGLLRSQQFSWKNCAQKTWEIYNLIK